ncbi:hypothetical protein LWI29_020774 [Acer saccharum]|uniref:Alkyl transferase n=1 Tax=Acer saccharum TaxID=4024 RepID=A0AA39TBM2_ACESA|nr:hypothetical protein LWI29_020774 [Acer saccharum]
MKRCGNNTNSTAAHQLSASLSSFVRRSSVRFLSVVPIPNHVAFIMDGNRSYSTKKKLMEGAGHKDGFVSLMYVLNDCYELGIKYVTIYAFSIKNFKRRPDEVQNLMDLSQEKICRLLEEESVVNQYGVNSIFCRELETFE